MAEEGNKILERIFSRDKNEGGVFLETIGPQGSGKTSFDFHLATKIQNMYPDELIFYRDCVDAPVQFNRVDKYVIFCQEPMQLNFRDYKKNENISIEYEFFKDYDDLYSKAQMGVFNIPFFIDEYSWIEFLNYLRRHFHRGNGWKTVILEEYEDIAPQYGGGIYWLKNREFANNVKHIRKGLVNCFVNTQKKGEVYSFVRGKLMMRSYLCGSKVDDISPLYQNLISNLKLGEAAIDYGENFGMINFKPFKPKDEIFEVSKLIPKSLLKKKKKPVEGQYLNRIKQLEKQISRLTSMIEGNESQ